MLVGVTCLEVLGVMTMPRRKQKVLSYLEGMVLLIEIDEKKLRRCKIAEIYGVSEATVSVKECVFRRC